MSDHTETCDACSGQCAACGRELGDVAASLAASQVEVARLTALLEQFNGDGGMRAMSDLTSEVTALQVEVERLRGERDREREAKDIAHAHEREYRAVALNMERRWKDERESRLQAEAGARALTLREAAAFVSELQERWRSATHVPEAPSSNYPWADVPGPGVNDVAREEDIVRAALRLAAHGLRSLASSTITVNGDRDDAEHALAWAEQLMSRAVRADREKNDYDMGTVLIAMRDFLAKPASSTSTAPTGEPAPTAHAYTVPQPAADMGICDGCGKEVSSAHLKWIAGAFSWCGCKKDGPTGEPAKTEER